MPIDFAARPNVLPWPPLLFVIALIVAIALAVVAPLPLHLPLWLRVVGALAAVAGVALWFCGAVAMRRAGANMNPAGAANRLIDSGPFAISRHPIYVGGAIAFFGVGVALSQAWLCVAALIAAAAVDRYAMAREEAHLAARFGADWTRYAARAPRWLGIAWLRRGRSRRDAERRGID